MILLPQLLKSRGGNRIHYKAKWHILTLSHFILNISRCLFFFFSKFPLSVPALLPTCHRQTGVLVGKYTYTHKKKRKQVKETLTFGCSEKAHVVLENVCPKN